MAQRTAILVLFLCLFICDTVISQRINSWNKKSESDLFVEGTYSLPVSSSIQLISLHDEFQSVELGNNKKFYFEIHAPKTESYLLKVQERRIVDYYMLQSKPGKINKGDNSIGPWELDNMLSSLNISSSNLAALVQVREDDGDYILPVTIKEKESKSKSNVYKAIFRLNKSIRSGSYKVYQGEHKGVLPDNKLLSSSNIGRQYGGSAVQIEIEKKDLKKYEGWVTVHLSLAPKDSMKKIPYTFYFYHNPA